MKEAKSGSSSSMETVGLYIPIVAPLDLSQAPFHDAATGDHLFYFGCFAVACAALICLMVRNKLVVRLAEHRCEGLQKWNDCRPIFTKPPHYQRPCRPIQLDWSCSDAVVHPLVGFTSPPYGRLSNFTLSRRYGLNERLGHRVEPLLDWRLAFLPNDH